MFINSISERLVYNNAKRSLRNANVDFSKARPTQSFLRLEQALATNKAMYQFQITNQVQGGSTPFNTEQRLNLQDSFVLSALQISIGKPSSATDATFKKNTYLNPFVFAEYAAMGVIYNGQLSLAVDNVTYIPNWDLERHMLIPQTQQTAAPGAASPLDEYDASVDGYFPVEPNIVLIGSKNLQLTINLINAPSAIDANSRLIITMKGILAQNSTSVK